MPADRSAALNQVISSLALAVRRRSGVDVRSLLDQSLGKALAHDVRNGAPSVDPAVYDHIADWLAASVANNLPWLANLDDNGAPRKFMKISGVKSLAEEAARGLERLRRQSPRLELREGDVERVSDLADGYTLVRLRSPAALDEESEVMQHCVGDGGYDGGLQTGEVQILSLRDPAGKPHATMEIMDGRISQIRGKQNAFPVGRYFDLLVPWIERSGHEVNAGELAGGYFMHGTRIRHVASITPYERFMGDLTIRLDHGDPAGLRLPDGLVVEGTLVLDAAGGPTVPVSFGYGTHVGEKLHTKNAKLDGLRNVTAPRIEVMTGSVAPLPRDMAFYGEVYISGADVGDMLETASFEAGLEIRYLPKVVVPKASSVRGNLLMHSVKEVEVEPGTVVVGNFECRAGLEETTVTVGDDVTVTGGMLVQGGSFACGERLEVLEAMHLDCVDVTRAPVTMAAGSLYWRGVSGIESLPRHLSVSGTVALARSTIKSLGMLSQVGGDLHVNSTQIDRLPYGLSVEGTLDISNSLVDALPEGLRVGRNLVMRKCKAGTVPDDARIGGTIDLTRNPRVILPVGLRVLGDLKLEGAEFAREPKGVLVHGMLQLGRTVVDRISRRFTARSYAIDGAAVVDASDLFDIAGDLHVSSVDVHKLPPRMTVGGDMVVHGTVYHGDLPEGLTVRGQLSSERGSAPHVPASAALGGERSFPSSLFAG